MRTIMRRSSTTVATIRWLLFLQLVHLVSPFVVLNPLWSFLGLNQQQQGHSHRRLKLFHNDGDNGPKDRIHKGWDLEPHEFPWMVKIKVGIPTYVDLLHELAMCYTYLSCAREIHHLA